MDNVHAHYVRNNTPVVARGDNDSWLMFSDRAVFVLNNLTTEYDFLGYANPPKLRPDATRLNLIKGAMPCSA